MPRTFTYVERASLPNVIHGMIADDYRYRVDGAVRGRLPISEIVVDDARAVKISKGVYASSSGVPTGRWLVDPHGANNLFTAAAAARAPDDPVFDSLDALRYVRRAMGEAAAVQLFNPESQDYRPKFDPFPRPAKGVQRYDLVAPALSVRDPTTSAGRARQLPGVRYFRRMSIYVSRGIVRDIRERISVEAMLDDPRSRLAARIGDYGITLPAGSTRRQAQVIVRAVNALAARTAQPGVRERDLHVRFAYPQTRMNVALPAEAQRVKFSSFGQLFPNSQLLYETSR
jgi:hypothetical protein